MAGRRRLRRAPGRLGHHRRAPGGRVRRWRRRICRAAVVLLRALGHERAAVLDGGWKHWTDLGLPTQTGVREVTRVARTERFDEERLLDAPQVQARSEEHTSELPSPMRPSYAVF